VYPEAKRWGGLLPMDLYRKMVDEAATKPIITHLVLNGLGEPLLDPHLVERLEYAVRARPDWNIHFHTNGVYLTPDMFEKLKAAGLSFLSISLNALDEPQHRRAMGLTDKFDIVCANAKYAIEHKDDMGINVTAIADEKNFTIDHAKKFLKRWGDYRMDGYGKCISIGNWSGDIESSREFKPNECCIRAITQIYVTYDGKVTTCCFDPTGKMTFGNVNDQSIADIYNSEAYVKFREDHSNDMADLYDICKGCTRI